MTEERLSNVESRLSALEQMVQSVDQRLRRLENPHAKPAPPPVQRPTPTFELPNPPEAPIVAPVAPPTPPQQRTPPSTQTAAEYKIGAQILPRVGALLLLLGVGYLVSLGLSNGWITPAMLFGGAVALCLAFMGVGQWKREEKEEFGQVLTGIGSCGLYLTIAGGHIFQKLYSGETLVALFLGLSLANLGYSAWRSSRSFLAIGVIGGFAAALMPLDKQAFTLNLVLHFAILLPSAIIALKRRWPDVAAWLWFFSSLAIQPALWTSHLHWGYRIAAFDLGTLICVAVYAHVYKPSKFDPQAVASALALALTALVAFNVQGGPEATIHLLAFATVTVILGWLITGEKTIRIPILATGWGTAVFVAPFGFRPELSALILPGLAAAHASISLRKKSRIPNLYGAICLGLSFIAYAMGQAQQPPLGLERELTVLVAMAVATVLLAFAETKRGGSANHFTLLASLITGPMLVRVTQTLILTSYQRFDLLFAVAIGIGLVAVITFAVTVVSGWESGTAFAALAGVLSLSAYALSASQATLGFAVEVGFLTIAALLAGSLAGLTQRRGEQNWTIAAASIVLAGLVTRASVLLCAHWHFAPTHVAIPMTLATYALLNSLGARWKELPTLHVVVGLSWAGAVFSYALHFADHGFAFNQELSVLLVLSTTLAISLPLANRHQESKDVLPTLGAWLGWGLFSRLAYIVLTHPGVGMQALPAVSLAWTVYAFAIMGLGFLFDFRTLRYSSLAFLTATVLKVLILDLSGAAPGIRVAVLMALGLVLIGGGYWYIQRRQSFTESSR